MKHAGFRHEALIYEGPEDYLAGTLPFLQRAVSAGEPAMVAVGPDQTRLLEAELGEDRRHVRFVDMRALGRNPAWIIPFWRDFLEEHEGKQVRGIGEAVWAARTAAALEECRRHEALINLAFADDPGLSLLCPYDTGTVPVEALAEVATSHHMVNEAGESRASDRFDPAPDALGGELPSPHAQVRSLDFGLRELAQVRRLVTSAAEGAGLGPSAVADFVTATSEIAANTVMHGGGDGVLRLWREGRFLLAEVEDRGCIEDPLVGRLRPGLTQEGGRGLWLTNQLCDLVQIRSGRAGTVVRLHMETGGNGRDFPDEDGAGFGDGDGETGGVAVGSGG
jgi:anti-sigma regulatory factor (Ser/Thr protein kinase)